MGLYKHTRSPHWWMWIEGGMGQKGHGESTKIRINGGTPQQTAANERVATELYHARCTDVARERIARIGKPAESRARHRDEWTYIYFIKAGAFVKIGRAINVRKRVRSLQVGHPEQMEVLAVVAAQVGLECDIQRHLKKLRVKGEWFRYVEPAVTFIDRVRAGEHPIAIIADHDARLAHDQPTIPTIVAVNQSDRWRRG